MKSLPTLLKLAERDLETLRRAMAAQITRQSAIEARIKGLEHAVRAEQQAALQDYESQRAYGGFVQLALQQRRALESERVLVEQEVERLRVLITEAHVEMRKFERLLELEAERARKAEEKRENAELDEFATLRAARQTSPR